MSDLRRLGADEEDRAAEFLAEQGFTLITRRYSVRGGEVDIVALDGDVLVFVEVRTRRHPDYPPEASLDRKKQERVFVASAAFLRRMEDPNREVRFDLIAISPRGMKLYRDAFRP